MNHLDEYCYFASCTVNPGILQCISAPSTFSVSLLGSYFSASPPIIGRYLSVLVSSSFSGRGSVLSFCFEFLFSSLSVSEFQFSVSVFSHVF